MTLFGQRLLHSEPPPLTSNPDVSGVGVLIGFLGTGFFALALAAIHYALAYDPARDPFEQGAVVKWWKPNPIDVIFLKWLHGLPGIRSLAARFSRLGNVFDEAILQLCDIQIATGVAVLLSGFIGLKCDISTYHWQTILSVAWFASVTHLSGLSVLRSHLHADAWRRNIRVGLMTALLILWIIAAVPSSFFDWTSPSWPIDVVIIGPGDPAICFINIGFGDRIFQNRLQTVCESQSDIACLSSYQWTSSPSFQNLLLSLLLITFSFFVRVIKLYEPLSRFARQNVRTSLSQKFQSSILARSITLTESIQAGNSLIRPSLFGTLALRTFLVDSLLGSFVFLRVLLDLFQSTLAEIYWLAVSLLWGTLTLLATRDKYAVSFTYNKVIEQEAQWTYGQTLPVFLLVGPLFYTIGMIFSELRSKNGESTMQMSPTSPTTTQAIVTSHPTDPTARQSMGQPLTDSGGTLPYPLRFDNMFINEMCLSQSHGQVFWFGPTFVITLLFIGLLTSIVFVYGPVGTQRILNQSILYTLFGPPGILWLAILGLPSAGIASVSFGLRLSSWLSGGDSLRLKRFTFFWLSLAFHIVHALAVPIVIFLPLQHPFSVPLERTFDARVLQPAAVHLGVSVLTHLVANGSYMMSRLFRYRHVISTTVAQ
ncbi:hypothetical protein F5Y07DRAFT_81395 [Xylaria sp. FL0933]|nr:hypothetical protein F5Y07DRAFT_81395 [Xylaria sp. FL0933]